MHCSFEFVAVNTKVVQHLMEDLPVMQNKRFNMSLPPPHWEDSPSISTYYALDTQLLDAYFRMHRRPATMRGRTYRGSRLARPPDTHAAPVCLLSVCPPFLVELCHRGHGKLVMAVSFNVAVLNDFGLQTLPPSMPYSLGMDVLLETRAKNHLRRMYLKRCPMSTAFKDLASAWDLSSFPDSDGEWVPPLSDISLLGLPPRAAIKVDSGDEGDSEAGADTSKEHTAAKDWKRPRGNNTRWAGKLRLH